MRLHSIKARNFMSLRDCCIDNLDAHMNFLVGPNGCDKTTVFRALKAIRDIFNPGKNVPFNQLCTRGVLPHIWGTDELMQKSPGVPSGRGDCPESSPRGLCQRQSPDHRERATV
jgi:AAA domain